MGSQSLSGRVSTITPLVVMVANPGRQNLNSVARALGVHPSAVTRTRDKLVDVDLLHRSDDPIDRRNLMLRPTESGRRLIHTIQYRRSAIANILTRMRVRYRCSMVTALLAFADAPKKLHQAKEWTLGWPPMNPPTAWTTADNPSSQVSLDAITGRDNYWSGDQ